MITTEPLEHATAPRDDDLGATEFLQLLGAVLGASFVYNLVESVRVS